MPDQGKNPGMAKGTLYFLSLETKGRHLVGGTITVTVTINAV